ncbi:RDD family protein [Streptomyces sp. V2I9]|uniref:RDD family protein n=1 Tax=Streptomyces sp. V2I9 TaxID=3042304 RepID=UPI00277E87FC|nr:RDD family protein [Streptomyces sp. V2I9]MDQ0984750.1 putative RDD family membrane protein YckC [Streptomyces sp. V2I9]
MSAPTPAPGDESPREGYYPDPSIPGYVRYWNGASWVPGTSRPAPAAPAAGARTAPAEETGPIFFDEEEATLQDGPGTVASGQDGTGKAVAGSGEPTARPEEPGSVWQADTARQTGFGGAGDRRVDWGGPAGPPSPGPAASPADPRTPVAQDPTGGALPGMRAEGGGPSAREAAGTRPPTDGTVTIRATGARPPAGRGDTPGPDGVRPDAPQPGPVPPAPVGAGAPQGPQNLSAARHSIAPAPEPRALPAPARPTPHQAPQGRAPQGQAYPPALPAAHQAPQSQRPPQPQAHVPAPQPHLPQAAAPGRLPAPAPAPADPVGTPSPVPAPPAAPHTPLTPGAGGGSASWAQQVHHLAQPEQQQFPPRAAGTGQPVVPWKPPVDDPFQQLARNQASARPAGLGKRFAARLVDNLVLGAVVGAAAIPLTVRALDHIDRKITAAKETGQTVTVWLLDSTTGALLGALLAAFLLLGFLLEALPTAKWGRTLGKKLFGLDVRDIESHEPPSLGAALRRWLVYGVLGLLVLGVVNVLWCLFDRPWRQCWHDKAARTFVAG